MRFVIEHLEEEMYEWSLIEYEHIASFVGRDNVLVTNVNAEDVRKVKKFADATIVPVADLELGRVCILDPYAEQPLDPKENFDSVIIGGILGDHPPRKRTQKELIVPKGERRNLGDKQMATDNAGYVAKLIVEGMPLKDIPFQDGLEIETGRNESMQFPYRYVLVDGKPLVSDKLVKMLKKKQGF